MSILRTVILAALCGIAMGGGNPTMSVNVNKAEVSNKPNDYSDNWTLTLTEGSPNTVRLLIQWKIDVPENLMLRFIATLGGKELPPIETTLCKGMTEESVGQPTVAQFREPFSKSCPIKKGTYEIEKYVVNTEKLPKTLPPGKFIVVIHVFMPGEEPFVTMNFEGEIKSKLLG